MDFSAVWPAGSEELTLFRVKQPKTKPRDWQYIWYQAKQACEGKGVAKEGMKARADSPIWGFLGTMFPDSTGSNTPAWLLNSGMGAKDTKGKIYYQARMVQRKQSGAEASEEFDESEALSLVWSQLQKDIPGKITIII